MQIERTGGQGVAYSQMLPHVICGKCEFCGMDYHECPHFKSIGELRCSYCPETSDPVEVVNHADMKIHVHPDNPDKLVVVCDALLCTEKHIKRFKQSV